MHYKEALEYLLRLDLTPFPDPQLEQAIEAAISALRDCLDMGLTGEPE